MMNKLNEENSPKYKKYFAKIEKATKNVIDVLDTVKEVQAIESGKKEINLTPIDIAHTFENLTFTFQDKLDSKKVQLQLNNELPKGKTFLADPISFNTSVLNNLISNAIKFSQEGDLISVTISQSEDPNFVQISAKDQGIGIPEDIRKNLFRTNVKTSRKGTGGEDGTGFGMPIVKSFVDKFGGRIEVQSWPQDLFPDQHGTEFKIFLKAADS
jgi:signal transduction histidine kinase